MSDIIKKQEDSFSQIEAVILQGDLSKLNSEQRGQYVAKICEVMGLNPLTKPFEFMSIQGKLVCYAGKNCAEQLRKVHSVSLRVTAREKIDDVYVVTVDASLPNGRIDSSTGAVPLAGLKGNDQANAMMKAETKAKRRATLSICSLGMLDETEVASIADIRPSLKQESNLDAGDGYHGEFSPDVIPFGQYRGKTYKQVIEEYGPEKVKGYLEYWSKRSERENKAIEGPLLDVLNGLEGELAKLENEFDPRA